MALLGDLYVFVIDEEMDSPVNISTHPVERGTQLTDHVQAAPATLVINGELFGEESAEQIRRWQRDGYVLSYIGRNIFPQAQIKSFSCRYTHRIAGGCEFSLTLQEVRVASTIFSVGLGYSGNRRIGFVNGDTTTSIINLSPKQNRFHTLMAGETLYFIANQFRGRGVTVQSLQMLNRARAVFLPGYQGDFERLKPNAKLLLGVW